MLGRVATDLAENGAQETLCIQLVQLQRALQHGRQDVAALILDEMSGSEGSRALATCLRVDDEGALALTQTSWRQIEGAIDAGGSYGVAAHTLTAVRDLSVGNLATTLAGGTLNAERGQSMGAPEKLGDHKQG